MARLLSINIPGPTPWQRISTPISSVFGSTTIKTENSVGTLQVWQANAGELDRHLKRLIALGLRRKTKRHKIILRAMMQIAVRHGAVETNPVDRVSPFGRRRNPARGKVQDQDTLPAFRAQIRAWANGEAIPGTPAYTCGRPARLDRGLGRRRDHRHRDAPARGLRPASR
ncbi:hypothetical protein [Nocardia sp. Marseille-Q1738]